MNGELSDKSKSGKERPWKKHKLNNEKLVALCKKIGRLEKAHNIEICSNFLEFLECPNGHGKRLLRANFCKDRICNICSWRKSLFLYHQVILIAHEVAKKIPGSQFLFLTLTLKNCPIDEVGKEITKFVKSYARFVRYKKIKDSYLGTFRKIEITYNPLDNTFHVHLHAIVVVKKSYFKSKFYLSQDEITKLWKKAAKIDYTPVCHVEKVRPKKKNVNTLCDDIDNLIDQELAGAAAEVAKYSAKATDIFAPYVDYKKDSSEMIAAKLQIRSDEEKQAVVLEELIRGLQNRRLVGYTGVFKEVHQEMGAVSAEDTDMILMPGEKEKECTCSICQSELVQVHYKWKKDNYYIG